MIKLLFLTLLFAGCIEKEVSLGYRDPFVYLGKSPAEGMTLQEDEDCDIVWDYSHGKKKPEGTTWIFPTETPEVGQVLVPVEGRKLKWIHPHKTPDAWKNGYRRKKK